MLRFDSSTPIGTRGSLISRALSHHILPVFLNLNGSYDVGLKTRLKIHKKLGKLKISNYIISRVFFINLTVCFRPQGNL